MSEEPSVLDYVLARLMPWRGPVPAIPSPESAAEAPPAPEGVLLPESSPVPAVGQAAEIEPSLVNEPLYPPTPRQSPARPGVLPWRSLLAFGLALLGQLSLEPGPDRGWALGLLLYLLAFAFLIMAYWRGEWRPAPLPGVQAQHDPFTVRLVPLLVGALFSLAAFFLFNKNRFTGFNLALWFLAVVFTLLAFWLPAGEVARGIKATFAWLRKPRWKLVISRWSLLVILATGLVLFFRFYRLEQVPPEMLGDHAEKLLDVGDVLAGQWSIFFPRNTGREAFQMYLTAAIARYLGTGLSFLSLKIGTVLAGLLTLPFLYLLGKELGSRRVGLLAAIFAGIAYWPNVISRMGLRFPLYALFAAPTLYYLLRGLRRGSRNDFILAGLFLGIGLHGYTPIRIVPFVVLIGVGIYLLHRVSVGFRRQAVTGLVVLAIISLSLFLPLLRYSVDNPEAFGYRAFTRLGSLERPLPAPAWQVFLQNTGKAMLMFAWDDGEIWPVSLPHRPALDVVTAALFYLGLLLLVLRYLRRRNWEDLLLVLAVPLLMLPSILSLAFPAENPAPNRASAALVPVFLIVAFALDGLMRALRTSLGEGRGRRAAWGLALVLVYLSSRQNYNLVFNQYSQLYTASSWNTSEMGAVIRSFAGSVGSTETAWVLAFPYWVDTRLVGFNAGTPGRDYAIWPDQLAATASEPRPKLFLVKPEDTEGMAALRQLYSQGISTTYTSKVEGHDFLLYFVPPLLPNP